MLTYLKEKLVSMSTLQKYYIRMLVLLSGLLLLVVNCLLDVYNSEIRLGYEYAHRLLQLIHSTLP